MVTKINDQLSMISESRIYRKVRRSRLKRFVSTMREALQIMRMANGRIWRPHYLISAVRVKRISKRIIQMRYEIVGKNGCVIFYSPPKRDAEHEQGNGSHELLQQLYGLR